VASGRAAWLGEDPKGLTPKPSTDLPRVAARVRALFGSPAG
jgi:hypothetical protein